MTTYLLGPVPCRGCGAPVCWNGKRWRGPNQRSGGHRCPDERPLCGAWMPYARERCARRAGHRYEHRTAYSLANAARAKRVGWAA